MKTKAVRIYGKMDLRLEEFELPPAGEDGILAEVVCDSLCMSSYKAAKQGPDHKRVPDDCATNPTMIGHEFAGRLIEVGDKWKDQFEVGEMFGIQPALMYKGSLDAPGYSFTTVGGDATYVRIPSCVMEMDCLLKYSGQGYFLASLAEPMSCLIGACKAQYHMTPGSYEHHMGIIEGGKAACLASAGPMGLGLVDLLIHGDRKPSLLVVTDIDQPRLDRAKSILTPEDAKAHGVELIYLNTATPNAVQDMNDLSSGTGFDDVFVLAPVPVVIEQGDAILARDGCLNFFAGPTDTNFSAKFNFYNVHYGNTHIVGTSGGTKEDMRDALAMMSAGTINPAMMITHVGGLTACEETTLHLPDIPGGKKLLYTHVDMPLTAIEDFAELGKDSPVYAELAGICERNNHLWSVEAEQLVLTKMPKLNLS
ncbi:MAG: zinc-binding dehydrogenase [Lentisphaerae bacterium]|jgi:L-sorbose 1-phosphate reductase|nr:zinc-binding dehydrogenase [Lentisphaerota bacterium]MBT5611918.1 zinc-binding dehydrogenase [Lentisphaerota bacterium]MBT7057928.1 zinc-binding dehydrogenase [Lentisphaerota bacterium]MBT7843685.1 zinc-binding dehydrogenase [Lentisphaerota bacterium]